MYFKIVEEDKKYFIKMTDNFYHFTTKFYKIGDGISISTKNE